MYIVTDVAGRKHQFEFRRKATEYARGLGDEATGDLTLHNTGNGKIHRWSRETGNWVLPEKELKRLMERQALFEMED